MTVLLASLDEGPVPPDATTPASDVALPARRRSELLRLVRARGQITVAEIAAQFEVSADTIRRDLDLLAENGLLHRTHGGAVAAGSLVGADAPYAQRLNAHKVAKTRIGHAAARLISDGETLLINGGSSTLAFAGELTGLSGLTVVTNHLGLTAALPPRTVRDIYLLGGQVRAEANVTLGPVAFAGTERISADTAVIGVGGLSCTGLSTTLLAEGSMIAGMMSACRRTIVLADSSKFGHNAFAHIAPLGRVHILVTDTAPPPDLTAALAEACIEVVLAGG
jgi:DeoR/GlpR family transcriptional regulator of sugar metabolism